MLHQHALCCEFPGDPGYEASIDSDAVLPGSPVEAGDGRAAPAASAALVGADIPSDCLSLLTGASAGASCHCIISSSDGQGIECVPASPQQTRGGEAMYATQPSYIANVYP